MKVQQFVLTTALLVGCGLLAACANDQAFNLVDKKSGQVLDTYHVMTDATNPLAPATATGAIVKNGKFVITGFVGTESPLAQLVPIGAAGIIANGQIQAAKATAPDILNVNNSSSSTSKGGKAVANGGDSVAIAVSTSVAKTSGNGCKPPKGDMKVACD